MSDLRKKAMTRLVLCAVALVASIIFSVLLLTGNGHANPTLGVPLHLPADLITKTVLLQAQQALPAPDSIAPFSQTWTTDAAPVVDYCADFEASRSPPPPALAPTR